MCLVTLGSTLHAGTTGHRLLRHQRGDPHGRALQPVARASASSFGGDLCSPHSPVAPDAIKKGLAARAQEIARAIRSGTCPICRSTPRRGTHLRRVIRVNSRPARAARLSSRARPRPRAAAAAADRVQPGDPAHHRCQRQGIVLDRYPPAFEREYAGVSAPIAYFDHRAQHSAADGRVEHLTARSRSTGGGGVDRRGQRPVDAFVQGLRDSLGLTCTSRTITSMPRQRRGCDGRRLCAAARRAEVAVYGVGLDPNM